MSSLVAQIDTQVRKEFGWLSSLLRQLVELESPSEDRDLVNADMRLVEEVASSFGGASKLHKQSDFGDLLEVRFGSAGEGGKQVLLLGHLDTVWPANTLKTMPWREGEERFWGPGVLDMKAGVAMALTALKVLKQMGLEPSCTLLLNSEEEVGSPVSRTVTERAAMESSAVFVLEPAQGLAYKTSRKGVANYVLEVEGVAAHSGVDFERGHSAVLELARQVETVSKFTDLARKRTVNCGIFTGGTRSNVIPAQARAEIDVRVATAEDAEAVDRLFRELRVHDEHCRLTVTGGMNRPPMERTGGTVALFEKARGFAAEMGFELTEAATGGGSDGNFTAALGVPTLDGMGAVGEGAHAAHEHVAIEHLVPRTALLAAMIAGVGRDGVGQDV